MINPEWLPSLVINEGYNDWKEYFNVVYQKFEQDFVNNKPIYNGRRLGLKKHPEHDGKSATFWHMVTEGEIENKRTICPNRCERISYPKPIIDNSCDKCLKIWTEHTSRDKRIHIWFEKQSYIVVLADRGEYILPWTAFYIQHEHQNKKYYNRWKKHNNK